MPGCWRWLSQGQRAGTACGSAPQLPARPRCWGLRSGTGPAPQLWKGRHERIKDDRSIVTKSKNYHSPSFKTDFGLHTEAIIAPEVTGSTTLKTHGNNKTICLICLSTLSSWLVPVHLRLVFELKSHWKLSIVTAGPWQCGLSFWRTNLNTLTSGRGLMICRIESERGHCRDQEVKVKGLQKWVGVLKHKCPMIIDRLKRPFECVELSKGTALHTNHVTRY